MRGYSRNSYLPLSLIQKKLNSFLLISYLGLTPFGSPLEATNFWQRDSYKENLYISDTSIDLSESQVLLQEDYYLIGPGDVLQLSLIDAPEFSGEYSVLNDGTIPLPLIGNVYLKNLSIDQASKMIEAKYKNELLRPELHLSVKVPRPKLVSVIGEIERPGIYSLTTDENTNLTVGQQIRNSGLPTIIDAIQKAGGITQDANLKKVIIMRRLPGIKKEMKVAEVNLLDLIFEGDHEQNLYLFDGDVIKITKASETPSNIMGIAQANLSPSEITVRIVGQVTDPGLITLNANTPLVQAVLSAGGPVPWKGNKGNVTLVRVNKNGSITKKKYKINLNAAVSDSNNPPLKDKDIVYVRPTTLNKISSGLGAVVEPISPVVTAVTLFKLIN